MTNEEIEKFKLGEINHYNNLAGSLKGYDCPKCKNRGNFLLLKDGYEYLCDCDCMSIRRLIKLAERSGLGDVLKQYTFEKYSHKENWQDYIYNQAKKFVADNDSHCFYIGGQIGCGKTHICTAIIKELIKQGLDCQYVIWNEIATKLKQNIMDNTKQYDSDIEALKRATVLYIDDLFKTEPTKSDIDKAFQVINFRYNQSKSNKNKRFITIISSEKTLDDLINIDEAIASRIYEMSKKQYTLSVNRDINKNMRFRV